MTPPVDASGLPLPPLSAEPDVQRAAPAPNGAGTRARTRQKAVVRFPYQIHAGITPAMNRAIERLSAGNSLLAGADVLRMALHHYLLTNDAHYRHELNSNGGG
jgi:hypothetical protein